MKSNTALFTFSFALDEKDYFVCNKILRNKKTLVIALLIFSFLTLYLIPQVFQMIENVSYELDISANLQAIFFCLLFLLFLYSYILPTGFYIKSVIKNQIAKGLLETSPAKYAFYSNYLKYVSPLCTSFLKHEGISEVIYQHNYIIIKYLKNRLIILPMDKIPAEQREPFFIFLKELSETRGFLFISK